MPESNIANDKLTHWRHEVIRHLRLSGFDSAAAKFSECGTGWKVDYCRVDLSHKPKVIPFTCKLPICPDCARRESARKLRRYLLPMQELVAEKIRGYRMRFVTLTTPFQLHDMTSDKYKAVWRNVNKFVHRLCFTVLKLMKKLSPAELKRGRADLSMHRIGVLAASEFSPKTKRLHFHFIMYSPFLSKVLINNIWRDLTDHECKVTDVREFDHSDVVGAIQEVGKYLTKFTGLQPVLVPRLLAVLKGSRRFRSYGALYALKVEKTAPCGCSVCGGERLQHHVMDYVEACAIRGVLPDDSILNAFDPASNLNLIHGNKSGEAYQQNIKNPDPPPPINRDYVKKPPGASRASL
jgi:hypothetical protein